MATNTLFKELLKQVKCEEISSTGFSQADLDAVTACIQNVKPPDTPASINLPAQPSPDCVPAANEEVKRIIAEEQRKLPIAIRKSILKAKVQELRDNLTPIKEYYDARYDFYTATVKKVEPSTSQYLYWDDEYNRLTNASDLLYITLSQTELYYGNSYGYAVIYLIHYAELSIEDSAVRSVFKKLPESLTNSSEISQIINQIPTNQYDEDQKSKAISEILSKLLVVPEFIEWLAVIRGKAYAYESREIAIGNATNSQNEQIQNIPALPSNAISAQTLIQNSFKKISRQLTVSFQTTSTVQNGLTVPSKTSGLTLTLIGKNGVMTKLPIIHDDGTTEQVDAIIPIDGNPDLIKPIFSTKTSFSTQHINQYDPESSTNPARADSDYTILSGLLYNGKIQNNSYIGLYNKIANPISKLFTLEDRGLTVNESQIDPKLKEAKDAPTSIKEDDVTLYVANQAKYEDFYTSLDKTYPKKIKAEYSQVYPDAIKTTLTDLKNLAQREAADQFRRVQYSFLKLARPTSYTASPGSAIFNIGTFTYSSVDSTLSQVLAYYKKAKEEIDQLIKDCDDQLSQLEKDIKENSMDKDIISKKILSIPCFSKTPIVKSDPNCEAAALAKLGTDPLYIHTLGGTDGSLPDFTTQCYWKKFTDALNKVSLLPFPDLSGPPPANTVFRYWPINCIIPAGPALVLLPIPPKWSPLFVLPTPLGTLVCLLTMPIAPVGIPLPSVSLFYFAPDTNKYLVASTNIPLLFSDPTFTTLKFGFELDNSPTSINPLGLHPTNPYKGQMVKGSIQVPVAVSAAIAKAKRLAEIAALIAQGKIPNLQLSVIEDLLNLLNESPDSDFARQVKKFRGTVNTQLNKLGEMQTGAIESLKNKLKEARDSALDKTLGEKDPAKRRKTRKSARDLQILELQEKIDGTLNCFDPWIDNIKFGTISYPKDATKHNPALPKAVQTVTELLELASRGDLMLKSMSLNKKLIKVIKKVNIKKFVKKTEFTIDTEAGVNEVKDALSKLFEGMLDYLKGKPSEPDTTGLSKEEAKRRAKAEKAMQDVIAKALALTAFATSVPIPVVTFDLSKKCCKTEPASFPMIDPAIAAAFSIILALVNAVINGLKAEDFMAALGLPNIKQKISIQLIFDMLIAIIESIPEVPLPDPSSIIDLFKSTIIPMFTTTSLPGAPNPLHAPMFPIVIPLDPILKPLIKIALGLLIEAILKLLSRADQNLKAASGADQQGGIYDPDKLLNQVLTEACGNTGISANLTINQVGSNLNSSNISITVTMPNGKKFKLPKIPAFPIDVIAYFELLTGPDIIELVRGLFNGIFDQVMGPIVQIVNIVSAIAKSLDTYEFNVIEAGIPQVALIKLLIMKLDSLIPKGIKTKIVSPEIMALIQAATIPALKFAEPVVKEVAWIGVLALCAAASPVTAYKTVSIARMVHPIVNQDDLPPWERLTHKNPLFSIFLDEIAWRGSIYSTGSLIFQTKTPAVLPYTPIFPIIHVSPHTLG
jgi:hypothetical protein